MGQRDQFVRATRDLAKLEATRPLRQPAAARDTWRPQLEDAVTKARTWLAALEPHVELLHNAALHARLPLPGVPAITYRHPPGPRAEEATHYMLGAFKANPALRQRVQIAVFRFYEARGALLEAEGLLAGPQGLAPDTVEDLRRKLYHLFHFHAAFAGEPLLSKLFPGPRTTTTTAAPMLTNVQRLKQKLARENAIQRVEELLKELAPVLKRAALVVEAFDHPRVPGLDELLVPHMRHARLMAIRLAHARERAAVDMLRAAIAAAPGARQALEKARRGGDHTPLEAATAPLATMAFQCRQHPLLAELVS